MSLTKVLSSALVATLVLAPLMTRPAYGSQAPSAQNTGAIKGVVNKANETPYASFTLTKSTALEVLATEHSSDSYFEGRKITLPAGTDLTILGGEDDPRYGKILRIGVDADQTGETPIDFWVRAKELTAGDLVPSEMGQGDNADLWASDDDDESILSEDTNSMAAIAKKKAKPAVKGKVAKHVGKSTSKKSSVNKPGYIGVKGKGGMTYCFRWQLGMDGGDSFARLWISNQRS
jgi:hypothetical protein